MAGLSERARELLTGTNFAFLAELMEDGSPHVSPVWIDVEGDLVLVNTAKGRLKEANMRRDPRVAISISPDGDPYTHVDIRGRVVEIREGDEPWPTSTGSARSTAAGIATRSARESNGSRTSSSRPSVLKRPAPAARAPSANREQTPPRLYRNCA